MPGRPQTKLKAVEQLEEEAVTLSAGVFLEVPMQYLEDPDVDDPLNRAWLLAVFMTMQASIQMEKLGDLLRGKAGVARRGPTATFCARDPDEETPAANGCQNLAE